MHNSGASRRGDAKPYLGLEQRHCERSEAIHSFFCAASMDCFASLAMTVSNAPHSQPSSPAKAGDPVFRGANDGIEMSTLVMPGLDPGIHPSSQDHFRGRWIAGHRRAEATPSFGRLCPAMTDGRREHSTCRPYNSLALLNANDDTRRVFSSRISVRVIGGSARWLQFSRSQSRQLTPIGVPSVFSRSMPVA